MPRKKKRPINKRAIARQRWLHMTAEQQAAQLAALDRGRVETTAKLKAWWAKQTPEERSERAREREERRRQREGESGVPMLVFVRPEQLAYLQEMAAREKLSLSVVVRGIFDERMYIEKPW
jgi:hypothetical protein